LAAWPDRPITIVHGLGPGGGVDTTARILAEHLARRLGQPVVVEPKPGAASVVAAGQVARSAPDGYTLALFPSTYGAAVSLRQNLGFRPVDDFAAVSLVSEFPYVIATYENHAIRDFRGLIDAGRNATQPILYATPGQGSAQHLLMELLGRLANIKLQQVPFRGGPQAVTEVLAKRIDLIVDAPLTLTEHFASGTLRPLAVTTKERSAGLPDTPAVSEAGFADFDVRGWMGLVAPAGLPDTIVRRLNAEAGAILADAGVAERLQALGTNARGSTPEMLRDRLASDIAKWTAIVAEAGIQKI
jgi:tripartite-type tricarboxylate transporter receptor subunit TctC